MSHDIFLSCFPDFEFFKPLKAYSIISLFNIAEHTFFLSVIYDFYINLHLLHLGITIIAHTKKILRKLVSLIHIYVVKLSKEMMIKP